MVKSDRICSNALNVWNQLSYQEAYQSTSILKWTNSAGISLGLAQDIVS